VIEYVTGPPALPTAATVPIFVLFSRTVSVADDVKVGASSECDTDRYSVPVLVVVPSDTE
jgi:hypothetical protein